MKAAAGRELRGRQRKQEKINKKYRGTVCTETRDRAACRELRNYNKEK